MATKYSMITAARRNASFSALRAGEAVSYGLQVNDVTGRLEAGWVLARMADRPGMLHEIHGTVSAAGDDVPRTDVVPAWRMAVAS